MKIQRLKIFTSNIEEQLQFYEQVLGMEIQNRQEEFFELQIGFSLLQFQFKAKATPYHIAFHIPAFKELEALDWLKYRTAILKFREEEVVDFPNWNARSVYFYDADKNIIEFISRRHCFPSEFGSFSQGSIIGISEIGIATTKVREAYNFLHLNFSLEKFTGDFNKFCATGDDEGLFIIIDKNQKDWMPTDDKAFGSDFEIKISTATTIAEFAYKDDRLEFL